MVGFERAAQRTGPDPCWSPRLKGAECRGSKLPCGSLDGTRKPSSARLRPSRARGSGTVKECQGLVEGSLELKGFRAVRGPTTANHNFKLPNLPLRLKRL